MAVDLISRGFTVNLFEMPEFKSNIEKLFSNRTIESSGSVTGRFELALVTSDIGQAIAGVKYILIVTPAFAHEGYARLLKGRVRSDQVVLLYPGAFAGLLFQTIFAGEACPVIAEANNLPYDARLTAPCKVSIFGLNRINIAFMPADKGAELSHPGGPLQRHQPGRRRSPPQDPQAQARLPPRRGSRPAARRASAPLAGALRHRRLHRPS
jgi:opine dehydrogenase